MNHRTNAIPCVDVIRMRAHEIKSPGSNAGNIAAGTCKLNDVTILLFSLPFFPFPFLLLPSLLGATTNLAVADFYK
jgi:hypothetical protein